MTKNSVSKLLNPPVPGYPSMPQANYTGMAVHGQATKRPKFTPNAQRSVINNHKLRSMINHVFTYILEEGRELDSDLE